MEGSQPTTDQPDKTTPPDQAHLVGKMVLPSENENDEDQFCCEIVEKAALDDHYNRDLFGGAQGGGSKSKGKKSVEKPGGDRGRASAKKRSKEKNIAGNKDSGKKKRKDFAGVGDGKARRKTGTKKFTKLVKGSESVDDDDDNEDLSKSTGPEDGAKKKKKKGKAGGGKDQG